MDIFLHYFKAFFFGCTCCSKKPNTSVTDKVAPVIPLPHQSPPVPVKRSASGTIVLGCGHYEIAMELDGTPSNVFFSLEMPCNGPVCGMDINKVGISITPNGFVIYADIKTSTCTIDWDCKF